MLRKRRHIAILLFFINIVVLMAAVVPHHHHEGLICMRHDTTPAEQSCPTHHHPENDTCCTSICQTAFLTITPSTHADTGPVCLLLFALFVGDAMRLRLLSPHKRRAHPDVTYRESMHTAELFRCLPLRAPPCPKR